MSPMFCRSATLACAVPVGFALLGSQFACGQRNAPVKSAGGTAAPVRSVSALATAQNAPASAAQPVKATPKAAQPKPILLVQGGGAQQHIPVSALAVSSQNVLAFDGGATGGASPSDPYQYSQVRLYDLRTRKMLRTLMVVNDTTAGNLGVLTFSPDGRFLAIAAGTEVMLWRVSDGKLIRYFEARGRNEQQHDESPDETPVTDVAFSPDGETLVSAHSYALKFWSVHSGRLKRVLPTYSDASIDFSPDGRTLAVTAGDGSNVPHSAAYLLNARTGRRIRTLPGPFTDFSRDGRLVANMSRGTTESELKVEVRRAGTFRLLHTLRVPTERAFSFGGFSRDGRLIVTTTERQYGSEFVSKTILWNAQSGTVWRVLHDFIDASESFAFTPDNKAVVTGAYDGSVRLWRLK